MAERSLQPRWDREPSLRPRPILEQGLRPHLTLRPERGPSLLRGEQSLALPSYRGTTASPLTKGAQTMAHLIAKPPVVLHNFGNLLHFHLTSGHSSCVRHQPRSRPATPPERSVPPYASSNQGVRLTPRPTRSERGAPSPAQRQNPARGPALQGNTACNFSWRVRGAQLVAPTWPGSPPSSPTYIQSLARKLTRGPAGGIPSPQSKGSVLTQQETE